MSTLIDFRKVGLVYLWVISILDGDKVVASFMGADFWTVIAEINKRIKNGK